METPLDNVRVVLVGTLYGGNVGSVCRAMANMGLSQLTLVAPQLHDWQEAEKLAVHAGGILAAARRFDTLEEAVADCAAVCCTTARRGLYRQHVKTPHEVAPELLQCAAEAPVALVFGREDNGLTKEEIALGTHLLRIPVDERYKSLNLSQAALICCYELFNALGSYTPPGEKAHPAPMAQRLKMMEMWREHLLGAGFMQPQKADHIMQGLNRILTRGVKTEDDCSIMMGIVRLIKNN